MNSYLGDIAVGATVRYLWGTAGADGASITRGTNGTLSVYKDNGTTQTTTGITDTEDFDSLTGVHAVAIDMSSDGTFYSSGSEFALVLSGAVIDGKTVNVPICCWSVNNRTHLRPTTAGRTLDVSSGGEAGIDWANIGSPTTTVGLTGTTVDLVTDAVDASALAANASAEIVTALFATVLETQGSITFQQALKIMLTLLAGRTSGGTFSTPNNAAARAAFTYTGNDRTGVTLTPDA
jgi:hypothetical protein